MCQSVFENGNMHFDDNDNDSFCMTMIMFGRIKIQSFQINLLACSLIRSASEKSLVICIYPNNVASDNHFNDDHQYSAL